MSHFTKCKTSLKDKELIKKACKRLGWEFQEGNFTITQYGTSEKAQIKFSNAVGLAVQEDGTWAMVGDPYHDHGKLHQYYRNEKKFAQDLTSAYAIAEAIDNLEEQNFHCVDNDTGVVGADGKIRMVFERVGY